MFKMFKILSEYKIFVIILSTQFVILFIYYNNIEKKLYRIFPRYFDLNDNNDYNNNDTCVHYNDEFSVLIDGVKYPKIIPQYYNNSIDFECLQQLNSAPKKILFWTNFHGDPLQDNLRSKLTKIGSSKIFEELKCPVTNCELTFNRTNYNESSLVLFHLRNSIDKYPSHRIQNQRWVIFNNFI